MYLYFDKNGVLKEMINDAPLRKGNSNWNKIFVYFEDAPVTYSATIKYIYNDDTTSNEVYFDNLYNSNSPVIPNECYIPHDKKRDLKYFEYFKPYTFFEFNILTDALQHAGTTLAEIKFYDDEDIEDATLVKTLQLVPYMVEGENVTPNEAITVSQYNYLLSRLGAFVSKSGDTMNGNLNMNNHYISGLVDLYDTGNNAYPKKSVTDALRTKIETETGYKISLELDSDYKLKAKLSNKNNVVIATSNIIDLPIETLIKNAYYDSDNKKLVFVLQDDTEIEVPLTDLIDDLATKAELSTEETRAKAQENSLSGRITVIESDYLTSDDKTELEADIQDIIDNLTVVDNKLNQNVEIKRSGNDFTYSGDTVTFNKKFRNLKTGTEETKTETIGLANTTTAGMMSPSDVVSINNLKDRVTRLEGGNIRLTYSVKTNPTATEINDFVEDEGYEEPFVGVSVIVSGTNHIWNYYTGDINSWVDDGIPMISQFTNLTSGTIKGSENDGQVYAENDGTGSVNGWSSLKTRVSDAEDAIETINDTLSDKVDAVEGKDLVDEDDIENIPLNTAARHTHTNKTVLDQLTQVDLDNIDEVPNKVDKVAGSGLISDTEKAKIGTNETNIASDLQAIKDYGLINIWDEEWINGYYNTSTGVYVNNSTYVCSANFIPVISSKEYYFKRTNDTVDVLFYDENKNFISSQSIYQISTGLFTTPNNCKYIHFYISDTYGSTYNHDICINISNARINGTYYPYRLPFVYNKPIIRWNQLVKNGNFANGVNYWNFDVEQYEITDNKLKLYKRTGDDYNQAFQVIETTSNHAYYVRFYFTASSDTSPRQELLVRTGTDGYGDTLISVDSYQNNGYLDARFKSNLIGRSLNLRTYSNYVIIDNVVLFDLTDMYGAGNEPTLEQCRQIFTSEYYEFDSGHLYRHNIVMENTSTNKYRLAMTIYNKNSEAIADISGLYTLLWSNRQNREISGVFVFNNTVHIASHTWMQNPTELQVYGMTTTGTLDNWRIDVMGNPTMFSDQVEQVY